MTKLTQVWIVMAEEMYEGSWIVDIYADEAMAHQRRDRMVAANERYQRRLERGSGNLLNAPEYATSIITVVKYPVIHTRRRKEVEAK